MNSVASSYHISTWIKISLLIFVIGLISILSYLFSQQNSINENTVPITQTTEPKWTTFTDPAYDIEFQYSSDFPSPRILATKHPLGGLNHVNYHYILNYHSLSDYRTQPYNFTALLSNVSDLLATPEDLTPIGGTRALQRVYETKDASNFRLKKVGNTDSPSPDDGVPKIPFMGPTGAYTSPNYIETPDSRFRGVYFFGNFPQSIESDIHCFILLTNGRVVFSFYAGVLSNNPRYADADFSSDSNASLKDEFSTYVQNIDPLTSNETVVQNFKKFYRPIAESIKTTQQ